MRSDAKTTPPSIASEGLFKKAHSATSKDGLPIYSSLPMFSRLSSLTRSLFIEAKVVTHRCQGLLGNGEIMTRKAELPAHTLPRWPW